MRKIGRIGSRESAETPFPAASEKESCSSVRSVTFGDLAIDVLTADVRRIIYYYDWHSDLFIACAINAKLVGSCLDF